MLIKNLFKYWSYQLFSPTTALREKYDGFESLLGNDKRAHELMAELEEIYYNQLRVDFSVIEKLCDELSRCVSRMVDDLLNVCPYPYSDLRLFYSKIDNYIRFMIAAKKVDPKPPWTTPLNTISSEAEAMVGGKADNLATIARELMLPVPPGFVVTTAAYFYFLESNDLREFIDSRLSRLDINETATLDAISWEITEMVLSAQIPSDLEESILSSFKALSLCENGGAKIAMRSSAVGEDSHASFAGQYLSVLNVDEDNVLAAYKKVIASKYSPRAMYYRINYGLTDVETPMAVLALKMIDARASGIVYTTDIDNQEPDLLNIHSIWGLGEMLVSGKTSSDVFSVSRSNTTQIVERKIGSKAGQMTLSRNNLPEIIELENYKKNQASIDDETIHRLAVWAMRLESYFQKPQDIEWCIDNRGDLYILQSRPLKTENIQSAETVECVFDDIGHKVLVAGGQQASSGIAAGIVQRIEQESDLENLVEGAVLVARNASPRYVKVMNKLNAVVTDTGSSAGHLASVAREFGVPALVNTGRGFETLSEGQMVTVYPQGGMVYEGVVDAMLKSPCARRDLMTDSPFMRKLGYVMEFVSTLSLVDPEDESFRPRKCRSLHDIIRYCHEKAVQEMFHISQNRVRKLGGAKKLESKIPMQFFVLDVGGGISGSVENRKAISIEEIANDSMKAVFNGLGHPDILWEGFTHFDWAEHDRIVMNGGIISPKATMFASHAVLSDVYMNLNLRFGYHFVIIDTFCGPKAEDNYILFRFSGGGADFYQRSLRADFLRKILQSLDFEVNIKSDLVDAQLKGIDPITTLGKLDMVGRLLGAARLMDMYLKNESDVDGFAADFMAGRYHFGTIDE
jgi:pyruvate,water dikinase